MGCFADLHRLVFVIVLVACAPPATRDMHAASPSAAAALAPSPTAPSAATADEPTAPTLHPSDEAGTVLLGLQALAGAKHLRDPDLALLEPALRSSYARMRADEDDPSSPVRPRRVALTAGGAEDTLVYEPRSGVPAGARTALVFLHGYGGSFALPCWQLARAVAPAGIAAVCPTLDVEGEWSSANGERLVRSTVDHLHGAGYDRLILAGLSNGAIGASRLAPKLKGAFAALVLVSGADPSAPAPGLPALVIQGRRDAIMAASGARTYAAAAHASYVDLDGGHFAMLLSADEVERALRAFVASL